MNMMNMFRDEDVQGAGLPYMQDSLIVPPWRVILFSPNPTP